MNANAPIAVTLGEPAGIGPELCVRVAERRWASRLIGIGDIELLRDRARRLRAGVRIVPYIRGRDAAPGTFEVAHFPLARAAVPGRLDPANAKAVLATLDAAATANGPLRVALATTHIALSAVPAAITGDLLTRTVRIVADELAAKFGIAKPRIAVCGLNPHAGEGGYLGREEVEIIAPALAALRSQGIDVAGPLPADTVFVPAKASQFDCVIALYHDQGLPVLKHASFGHGVNVTLGLPIVRTSVDHGTALDLAADGAGARRVDPGSMFAAVELAIELSQSRS